MGGEEFDLADGEGVALGLPPRGRGRVNYTLPVMRGGRITPAWAGKRMPRNARGFAMGDYPRVGGEESEYLGGNSVPMGLPPRGRGRALKPLHFLQRGGITPAWAGKRPRGAGRGWEPEDYPRVGGEESSGD